jgi:hypothetical protein
MKRLLIIAALTAVQLGCTPPPAPPEAPRVDTSQSSMKPAVDQGPNWTRMERAAFYSQDQGSKMIPLRWMAALKQPNGDGFLADGLARYGYLKNNENPNSVLPVGFTTNGPQGAEWVGMTCSACHTRQIQVQGATYRIDGGPAIADFHGLLIDLDQAVSQVLTDGTAFSAFARQVLEGEPNAGQLAQLQQQVNDWYLPYHTIVSLAVAKAPAWGPSRLDAVGMIFNRLTGLDIGTTPNRIIDRNIKPADAPVRYPFLWNAARQDKTQWPGFADNGDALLALARNTGEVIGVFAQFHPSKDPSRHVLKVNYSSENSADTDGLMKLEELVRRIGPPRWQWAYDETLRAKGEAIFNWPAKQGGCVECHGIRTGQKRVLQPEPTWATPVMDVGTDNRQYKLIGVAGRAAFPGWIVDTGVLAGAEIPLISPKLKQYDSALNVLKTAVVGGLLQRLPTILDFRSDRDAVVTQDTATDDKDTQVTVRGAKPAELAGAFPKAAPKAAPQPFVYESRVLQGIWAAAPYLHNGSVPTLADLLKADKDRPLSFKVGPDYDPVNVGLAVEQTRFNYTLVTGCTDRTSGNSNCGHNFGTTLTPDQKAALLEYLKVL